MSERQVVLDAYFNHQAPYWKSVYERHDISAAILQERSDRCLTWVRELQLAKNTEVLEAGCGAGLTAVRLAELGYRVRAVDHAPAMLELTAKAAQRAAVESLVSIQPADTSSLTGIPDNAFDLVISLGVLAWLDSPQTALQAFRRVLKPKGRLILSIGNLWALRDVLDPPYNPLLSPARRQLVSLLRRAGWLSTPKQPDGAPVPRDQHLPPAQVDRMLAAAGFAVVKSTSVGFGPLSFFRLNLFSDATSIKLHRALQAQADKNHPLFQCTGAHYMVLAAKSA